MNPDLPHPPKDSPYLAICRESLRAIPSLLGRLAWISERRDPGSDRYYDPRFGSPEAEQVLASVHNTLFDEWLNSTLEVQMRDLQRFLSFRKQNIQSTASVENWRRSQPLAAIPPSHAIEQDRELFFSSINILLALAISQLCMTADSYQTSRRITTLLRLVQAQPAPWSMALNTISREIRLSEDYIRHLFKSATGVTFRAFLRHLRMCRAAYLLRTTFLSIEEVASTLSYDHTTNFSRDFRAFLGVSPAGYRVARSRSESHFGDLGIDMADIEWKSPPLI